MNERTHGAKNRLYMDIAATTPVDSRVLEVMTPLWQGHSGNASSIHAEGIAAKKLLSNARTACAGVLHAHADEIIFTSGGTESNNLALLGTVAFALKVHNGDYSKIQLVTSAIEHASVLEVCKELECRGARVTYVPVDKEGIIVMSEMKKAITPQTTLVSVMMANNEIGTIQPIREVSKLVRMARKQSSNHAYPYFHIDAAQVPVWMPVYVEKLGVDIVSIDGHKIFCPKGVGLLYMRRGVHVAPLFFGGGQESGIRPGTEPIPLIVGLAKALEIAESERGMTVERMSAVRAYFRERIQKDIPEAEIHGGNETLPNIVNISVRGFDSDFLVISLDERGIACASKSACHAHDDSSHVVAALGKGEEAAMSALRFSMPKETTKEDIDRVVDALEEIVAFSKR